jgi:hypothetical protein
MPRHPGPKTTLRWPQHPRQDCRRWRKVHDDPPGPTLQVELPFPKGGSVRVMAKLALSRRELASRLFGTSDKFPVRRMSERGALARVICESPSTCEIVPAGSPQGGDWEGASR